MTIYDHVPASTLEAGDQVLHNNDYIELHDVIDSGEAIMIQGYSHISGDTAVYIVPPDTEVGLWTA